MKVKTISKTPDKMDATPTPRILGLLENLSVEPWRCVAELVDNALDDFRSTGKARGKVEIYCSDGCLYITDDGSGMSYHTLEHAIKAGYSSKNKYDELGLFGIGFNIACARLGRQATVWTRQEGEAHWLQVVININELIKNNTFKIQPEFVDLDTDKTHGTIVAVSLDRAHLSNFERARYMQSISDDLGKAYSFLLRDSVPGLSGDVAGNSRDITILVNGSPVKPEVPCIWDESRKVTYKGSDVFAVQKFRKDLPDGCVCDDCGHWHPSLDNNVCEKCKASSLSVASRSVWGWIGVQRYMDKLDFGISFLRNGRHILIRDQKVFSFSDPTTGETFKDYPVEWPADAGRIVGEVHCDHVKVDFIKREFDADDPYWKGVIEIVRGSTSLQPKRQKNTSPNNSPMARIFNAFRINEPGTKYLISGNGEKAIHEATRNWGKKFRSADKAYVTDKMWYDAAKTHDDISKGNTTAQPTKAKPISPILQPSAVKEDGPEVLTSTETLVSSKPVEAISKPKKQTINQKMDRWKSAGTKRVDLSKTITPPSIDKSYSIECWETFERIVDDNDNEVAVIAVPTKGNAIVSFAYRNAEIFKRYGRTTTDMLLMETANQIKALSTASVPMNLIYEQLLHNLPDQEHSEKVLRSRISEIQLRLQAKVAALTKDHSQETWKALSKRERESAENNAAGDSSTLWSKAIEAGSFGKHLSLGGIKDLVDHAPSYIFDGKLFKQHYASAHAIVARERSQGYIAKALDCLNVIATIPASLNDYEIRIAEDSLDFLNDSLVDDG